MNGNWQWQEMVWDSPAAPAVGAAALECLATAVEVGPLSWSSCWAITCRHGCTILSDSARRWARRYGCRSAAAMSARQRIVS